jgi:hypothetical protein
VSLCLSLDGGTSTGSEFPVSQKRPRELFLLPLSEVIKRPFTSELTFLPHVIPALPEVSGGKFGCVMIGADVHHSVLWAG